MVKLIPAEDIMLVNYDSDLEKNHSYGNYIQKNDDHTKALKQNDKLCGDKAHVQGSPLLNFVQIGERDIDSSPKEEDNSTEDEEVAKQLAKAMKVHLPEVLNKRNTSHAKHAEDIGTTFKIKASDEDDSVVQLEAPCDKRQSKRGSHEKIAWEPKIEFTSSIIRSKGDSGKTSSQSGHRLDNHLIEATAWKNEKQLQDGLIVPPRDPKILNKLSRKQVKDTLGAKWFDMPTQTITPELKKDLQLLKLRSVLDPKRHYKADDSKGLPKYFQVGTVIEHATEFYSQRLTKKERKPTIADELLSNPTLGQYRKRKYTEIANERNAYMKKGQKQKKKSQKRRT